MQADLKKCLIVLSIVLPVLSRSCAAEASPPPSIVMSLNETYAAFRHRLLMNYRPEDRPSILQKSGSQLVVNVTVHISSFSGVSVENMELIVGMYLAQQWLDERLSFKGPDSISLNDDMTKRIWTPDTYFPDEKAGYRHELTKLNAFIRIFPNGTVYYNQRIRIIFSCIMSLHWFPVDFQTCPIVLESYGHMFEDIKLQWYRRWEADEAGDIVTFEDGAMQSPEFGKPSYYVTNETVSYGGTNDLFSSIKVWFVLRRQIGFYLLDAYLPFVCIVMVSWSSCWISVSAVPARASIGVITVLSVVVHNEGIQRSMPHVNYIKALDLYMIVSLMFVILALAQFCASHFLLLYHKSHCATKAKRYMKRLKKKARHEATTKSSFGVHYSNENAINEDKSAMRMEALSRHSHKDALSPKISFQVASMSSSACSTPTNGDNDTKSLTDLCDISSRLDRIARIFLPISFILFNFIYWICLACHTYQGVHSLPKKDNFISS